MSPMLDHTFSSGPAAVLSPLPPHPQSSTNPFGAPAFAPPQPQPSRKRSRDEAAFEDAMNTPSDPPAPAPAPPAPKEEPIYGEGMVLLNPRSGLAVSAESQTGTWYEEKSESATVNAPPVASRSQDPNRGRKSKRLDPSAPGLDDIALSSIQHRLHHDNDDARLSPRNRSPDEPLVDDTTHLLGISWQRIGTDDPDMAAAVRGWTKCIDRQFSPYLQDSEILMKNRALNAYLASARPLTPLGPAPTLAYYLFNDDLTRAQLVASTWESCVQNLHCTPIVFEGNQVLSAVDSPQDADTPPDQTVLSANPADACLPLLQTMCAQPAATNGVPDGSMGTGMEIDA